MLSWIAAEYFEKSPVLIYPVMALFLFMGMFLAAGVRVFLKRHTEIDRLARLPLEDDDPALSEDDR